MHRTLLPLLLAAAALNAVFDKANAQLRRASKKRQEVRK